MLLFLGVLNYQAGKIIFTAKSPHFYLAIFVGINIVVLLSFKYTFWILSFINPIFNVRKSSMPLGISFFTFHAISYLVDIYRKKISPSKSAIEFLTYFCMFQHLIAGPIVRYAQIEEEIPLRGPDNTLLSFGVYRFLVGLNKKIIIANSVSVIVETAFTMSWLNTLSFFDAWLGIVAYSVQIYFDFSGYSDMAIGLAAMAGFRFNENFNRPYSSKNMQEF
ncbi:MAG: MBOAT family protein, partial [Deltaproteobacteria bacterium]|nr:MBOAT family protein [Deltaproteobacteria bacterium]